MNQPICRGLARCSSFSICGGSASKRTPVFTPAARFPLPSIPRKLYTSEALDLGSIEG